MSMSLPVDEVLQKIEQGEALSDADLRGSLLEKAQLKGASLIRCDLSESKLVGAVLNGASLSQSNFERCDLRFVDLCDADVSRCAFVGSRFHSTEFRNLLADGADFRGVEIERVKTPGAVLAASCWDHATLRDVDFSEVESLDRCSFREADLDSVLLTGVKADGLEFCDAQMRLVSFLRSQFRGSVFEGSRLSRVTFDKSSMRTANLREIKAIQCTFRDADLSQSDMAAAVLEACDLGGVRLDRARLRQLTADPSTRFTGATLDEADLTRALLDGVDFSNASLKRAILDAASLKRSILTDVNLRGARFLRTALNEAHLNGADLRDSDFEDADLRGASLRNADLRGASLTRTCLHGTDLEGARVDWERLSHAEFEPEDLLGSILHGPVPGEEPAEGIPVDRELAERLARQRQRD